VLGTAAVLEQGQAGPAFDKQENRDAIANIARHIDRERCESFVFSPVRANGPPTKYQIDAMWAQMEVGLPTLNGYSGNVPPGWPLADTMLFTEEPEPTVDGAIADWVKLKQLDASRVCWLRIGVTDGGYWATFVSQSVPRYMVAGQRYPVQVTLKNTGQVAWLRREGFRLGSQAPRDNDRWGLVRVRGPGPVPPGATAVFSFEVTAPATPGVYPFQWKMIQEGVVWFGEPTQLLQIAVAAPADVAAAPR
jgi:hypothetical protein